MTFRDKVLSTARATVDQLCIEIANWDDQLVYGNCPWQEADKQIRLLQEQRDKTLRFIAKLEKSMAV